MTAKETPESAIPEDSHRTVIDTAKVPNRTVTTEAAEVNEGG